jgi:hypothetical protein
MQKMATKRLGRGLEALLVDVPNEAIFTSSFSLESERKQLQQEQAELRQSAEQLKSLLETFEQLVLQLEPLENQTL